MFVCALATVVFGVLITEKQSNHQEETSLKPPSDLHKVAAQLRADGASYLEALSENIKKKYPVSGKHVDLKKMDFLPKNLAKNIQEKMAAPLPEPDLNASLAKLREPFEQPPIVPPKVAPLRSNASMMEKLEHEELVRDGEEKAVEMTAERDLSFAERSLPRLQNGSSLFESTKKTAEPLIDRLSDADQQIRLNLMKLAKPLRLGGLLEKVLNHHSKADDHFDRVDAEMKEADDKAQRELAKLKKDLGVSDAAPSSFIERASSDAPSSFVERSSSESQAQSQVDQATFQSSLIYVPKHLKTHYGEIGEKLKRVMEKSHAQLERMQKLRSNLLQETSSMLEESDDPAPA
jgi:hypothetical protein